MALSRVGVVDHRRSAIKPHCADRAHPSGGPGAAFHREPDLKAGVVGLVHDQLMDGSPEKTNSDRMQKAQAFRTCLAV